MIPESVCVLIITTRMNESFEPIAALRSGLVKLDREKIHVDLFPNIEHLDCLFFLEAPVIDVDKNFEEGLGGWVQPGSRRKKVGNEATKLRKK